MMGIFVQVNSESVWARSRPIGYFVQESGCWQWAGANNGMGYARMRDPDGGPQNVYVHRWMYEKVKGPIPDGLHLDHLCRSPGCVNPYHLEAVTPRENVIRGVSPSARIIREGTCIRGHDLNDTANTLTYTYASGQVQRFCRACKRIRRREHKAAGRKAA